MWTPVAGSKHQRTLLLRMTIPPGGMDTITLDPTTQQQLMQQGWVNFFAMDAS
jgi:hypothetical protein